MLGGAERDAWRGAGHREIAAGRALPPPAPARRWLPDAVEALASAPAAAARRFGPVTNPWPLIVIIADGMLLAPRPG